MPDYEEIMGKKNQTVDEIRKEMKKEGRLPPRTFDIRPINIASTGMDYLPFIIFHVICLMLPSKETLKYRYIRQRTGKHFMKCTTNWK